MTRLGDGTATLGILLLAIRRSERTRTPNMSESDRWRNGLMIDSLLDPDLATLLEELHGEEP